MLYYVFDASCLKISLFTVWHMRNIFLYILRICCISTTWKFIFFFPCRQMSCGVCSKKWKVITCPTMLAGLAKKEMKIRALEYQWAPTCLRNWEDYVSVVRVLSSSENFLGLWQPCDVSEIAEAFLRLRMLTVKVPYQFIHSSIYMLLDMPSLMSILSSPMYCTCLTELSSPSFLTQITTVTS